MNISNTSNHTFRIRLWLAARVVVAVFLVGILVFVGIVIYNRHVDDSACEYVAPSYPITAAQAGFVRNDTVQVQKSPGPSSPTDEAVRPGPK